MARRWTLLSYSSVSEIVSLAVVIPSYNSAEFLPAVIASVLGQIQPPDEILLIDDGSTDATSEIAAKFSDRIRFVRQENGGVSSARNHGARLTKSEWLLFLDSDDLLLPHATQALLATAEGGAGEVVYGRVIARGPTPADARLHGLPSSAGVPPHPAKKNFKRAIITTPGAAIVRRAVFGKAGGFVPGFEPMEDRDFWVKCGMLTRFGFCDTVVLDKTFREGSAGTQVSRRIRSGLHARLAFFDWCRKRDLDVAFLETSVAGVVDAALKEAVWYKRWEIIDPLLTQAAALGVKTFWTARARVQWRGLQLLGLVK